MEKVFISYPLLAIPVPVKLDFGILAQNRTSAPVHENLKAGFGERTRNPKRRGAKTRRKLWRAGSKGDDTVVEMQSAELLPDLLRASASPRFETLGRCAFWADC